jgi:hypothetical protein
VITETFDATGLLSLSAVLVLVIVLAFIAFVVVAGKDLGEGPEPRGQAIYLHLVQLITMFVSMIAATAVVASLSQLIGTNVASGTIPTTGTTTPSGTTGITGITGIGIGTPTTLPFSFGPTSLHPVGDAAARGVVAGMILLLVAGGLFVWHWGQARRFREDPVLRSTNSGRVLQAYLNTATFVAVLILIVTASLAAYAVFEAAAPGVAQSSGHVPPLRGLIPLLFFSGANFLIVDRHWRAMRPLRGVPMPAGGVFTQPAPAPETPPSPSAV